MAHDSSLDERSAFAQALYLGCQRSCDRFAELLTRTRIDDPEQACALFEELEHQLRGQMVLEEELMLRAFELEAHEQADLLRAEHRQLRGLLDLVALELREDSPNRRTAESFLGLLRTHTRHDTQLLHPWVDHCLPQRSKVRILERLQMLSLDSEVPPVLRSGLYAREASAPGLAQSGAK
jgi:hypothetical protein